jgi:hypothetical protein
MSCTGRFAKILLCVALLSMAVSAGAAQRRRPGEWPGAVRGGGVVFIGGYFYDPFYGPYPWWPPAAYPFPYYPLFDNRAEVRVLVTPEEAAVYVDGFYAGVVDDFNGFFQRLPLPPGGHDIVVYYDGYRTVHHRVYLQPDSTFKIEDSMEKLGPGERSEMPPLAPAVPPPPVDTYTVARPPLHGAFPTPPLAGTAAPQATVGTLELRIQPADAEVTIDGERWSSSDGERFVVQLAAGPHRVEVVKPGYDRFSTEVQVREGGRLPRNVTLTEERRYVPLSWR